MRILTLTRGFYPAIDFGGPAIAAYETTRRLAAAGHDVTVYTSNLRDKASKLYPATTECDLEGVRVVYLNSIWQYNYAAIAPDVLRYARREIRSFDVVNIYGLREFLTMVVAEYARRAGVPYILQPLGNMPRYRRSAAIKLAYDAMFRRRLLAGAAAIVARSQLEAEQISSFGIPSRRIAIVPNGVDVEHYRHGTGSSFRTRWGIGAEERVVLYVGRIAAIKSLHVLLDAFARVTGEARLVLAGPPVEPSYARSLRDQCGRLGIAEQVLFVGALDGEDKVSAYHAADIFVLPSVFETFGLVAAEAIASGTPVIVTTGCGLAPLIHERVGLAVEHSSAGLAVAIERLLRDEHYRGVLAKRCVDVATSELSWAVVVERLTAVFRAVVR